MTSYSPAFKARVVQRLVGPRAISANRLAPSVGVSQETLSRWLREAHSVEGMTKKRQTKWTGAEKLRVVEELWDDIEATGGRFPLPAWHRGEAELDANPALAITRDELWRRVGSSNG